MGQINLYQYTVSPFTEKVRRVLTYKHLKWNPIECHYEDKTNLLKVTAGKWTRVPVLEWDGQVVFNSVDIIKWLDQRVAQPTVFPDNSRGLCEIVDHWADNTLFMPVLVLTIPDLLDNAGDAQLKQNRETLIGMSTAQCASGTARRANSWHHFADSSTRSLREKTFSSVTVSSAWQMLPCIIRSFSWRSTRAIFK